MFSRNYYSGWSFAKDFTPKPASSYVFRNSQSRHSQRPQPQPQPVKKAQKPQPVKNFWRNAISGSLYEPYCKWHFASLNEGTLCGMCNKNYSFIKWD